jgi:hypothetical protein
MILAINFKYNPMNKAILLALVIILKFTTVNAQQYYNVPGLEKLQGYWRYINNTDTVTMQIVVKYIEISGNYYKGADFYYSYKQGAHFIVNNVPSSAITRSRNYGNSSLMYGPNLDSLNFSGKDPLKNNKYDAGYVAINAAGNQLSFVRDLNINGGGVQYYPPDRPPLPGWTLPSGIVFTRYTIPPTGGD